MLNLPPSFMPQGSVIDAYLRHSSDNQSIASQENALRAWCMEHHIIIARVYKDEAKSGASVAGRDEFLKMFHLLVEGNPQPRPIAVLIWSWSRFSREVQDAEYYKTRIRYEAKIQVWSMTDNIPEGKFAGVFEAFQHVQDQDARTRLITDTTRGLHDLALAGYSAGGFPPVGYMRGESIVLGKKKNGETKYAHKWAFDPQTHDRVNLAWQMRLEGKQYSEIHQATRLFPNQRGFSDFFRCITYAGAIKCGETITWEAHPAYITRAEWESVQSANQSRADQMKKAESHPARRRSDSPYLVSGKLQCGYCGWAMVGSMSGLVPYYRCNWRHRQGHSHVACKQPAIVAHAVHDQLSEIIATRILTFEEIVRARDSINASLSGNAAPMRERQQFLQAEQRRVQGVISNLVTSLEKFGPVGEIADRLNARRAEVTEIQVELAEIGSRISDGEIEVSDDVLRLFAEEAQYELQTGSVETVKPIFQQVIHQATLYLDEIHIAYSAFSLVDQLAAQIQKEESAAFATLSSLRKSPLRSLTSNKSVPLTGNGLVTRDGNKSVFYLQAPFLRPGKGHNRRVAQGV